MTITTTELDTSVWKEIKDKLVAGNIFVTITASSTTTTTAVSIEANYADEYSARPTIFIYPADIDASIDKFGSTNNKYTINVVIDCVGQVSKHSDEMSQKVRNILTLNDISGIDLIGVTSNSNFSAVGRNKFYIKSSTYTYERE